MIYGYAAKRTGSIITHIIGFDTEIIEDMEEHSHRFDGSTRDYGPIYEDIPVSPSASFIHLTERHHEDFIKEFDIHLVDSKKELNFLKKIMT